MRLQDMVILIKFFMEHLHEGKLNQAIRFYSDDLQRKEDVKTTLISGPEDAWQFSVMIFIVMQANKFADRDIKNYLDDLRRRGKLS